MVDMFRLKIYCDWEYGGRGGGTYSSFRHLKSVPFRSNWGMIKVLAYAGTGYHKEPKHDAFRVLEWSVFCQKIFDISLSPLPHPSLWPLAALLLGRMVCQSAEVRFCISNKTEHVLDFEY